MNILTEYRMLNELRIKYCNGTYFPSVIRASVVVVVVLQWYGNTCL